MVLVCCAWSIENLYKRLIPVCDASSNWHGDIGFLHTDRITMGKKSAHSESIKNIFMR